MQVDVTDAVMGQGVKRKLDDYENDKSPGRQRQSILDISVGKLHVKTKKRVEPPLLRSVLILNTLKQIESELLKEGVQSQTNTSAFAIPEVDPNSTVIDFPPDQEEVVKTFAPVVAAEQSGPLPSIDTFVGCRLGNMDQKGETRQEKSLVISDENSSSLHSSSFRLEELFNDFDFTVYDTDVFSSVSNSSNLTPLSAEEVLHSFPASSSSFCESYTTLTNASLTPFCKGEAAFDDLDNIMQILVGS